MSLDKSFGFIFIYNFINSPDNALHWNKLESVYEKVSINKFNGT